jgi:outer membrane protein OmpA-like peptidoglycan-associated protein
MTGARVVRSGALGILLASLSGAGCAARQTSIFVLLPEKGSVSSAVTVTNAAGSQVLSRPYQAAEVEGPGQAPRPAAALDETKVERLFGEALSAMPAPPLHFVLYFESDSTDLTAESRAHLPAILAAIGEREPAAVGVVGHTDTTGATGRNYRLSLERAAAVAALLRSLGAAPASLETDSHGEAELLVPTGDGVAEARNRRVEVTVR